MEGLLPPTISDPRLSHNCDPKKALFGYSLEEGPHAIQRTEGPNNVVDWPQSAFRYPPNRRCMPVRHPQDPSSSFLPPPLAVRCPQGLCLI